MNVRCQIELYTSSSYRSKRKNTLFFALFAHYTIICLIKVINIMDCAYVYALISFREKKLRDVKIIFSAWTTAGLARATAITYFARCHRVSSLQY